MPPVDNYKPSMTTRPRNTAVPTKKLVKSTTPKSTRPVDAQASMVTIGNGNSLDSDVTRMRQLAGPNGPGGNSLSVPRPTPRPDTSPTGPNGPGSNSLYIPPRPTPDPTRDPDHPAGPNGPGGNSLNVPAPSYDPTTDPNHPAGPNGPGGNSLNVPEPNATEGPEYIGPGSDTFNEHYGVEDSSSSSDSEYIGPGSDTFNEHYGVEETPSVETEANETPEAGDEPFVIADGDEDNPYEGHNATSVTVTPWDGHGEDGSPNDSISSILLNQGYTLDEILAKDDNGQSLIDQVAQANDIENPDIIHAGDDLVVPTRSNPTPETPEPAAEPAEPATPAEPEDDYDPTTDPNHPAGPNGPGGNSLGVPPSMQYDPTTDPNHPAGPNGPGGNSLNVPTPYDPTTDPNHPAGPNGPGGNSLNVPAPSYDPTTDPNHPAGPNGPGGNSLGVAPGLQNDSTSEHPEGST